MTPPPAINKVAEYFGTIRVKSPFPPPLMFIVHMYIVSILTIKIRFSII